MVATTVTYIEILNKKKKEKLLREVIVKIGLKQEGKKIRLHEP